MKPPRLIALVLLLLAFAPMPIGYYRLLRVGMCGLSVYFAFETRSNAWRWTWIAVAVVFNPFLPLYLGRGGWRAVDLAVIAMTILSLVDGGSRRGKSQ
jgi:hypothetical protein